MQLKFSDGSDYKISNPFFIAQHKNKYMKMDATFIGEDFVLNAPILDHCEGCFKKFEERPVSTMFYSEDLELNRKLKRPARICVICYFQPYYDAGHKVPSTLLRHF